MKMLFGNQLPLGWRKGESSRTKVREVDVVGFSTSSRSWANVGRGLCVATTSGRPKPKLTFGSKMGMKVYIFVRPSLLGWL